MGNVKEILGNKISFSSSNYKAVDGVDALLIATEWSAFRNPDFNKMKSVMKQPIIFDGRNLYDLNSMSEKPFYYQSVGRKIVNNLNK